jgi:hypothetical protein
MASRRLANAAAVAASCSAVAFAAAAAARLAAATSSKAVMDGKSVSEALVPETWLSSMPAADPRRALSAWMLRRRAASASGEGPRLATDKREIVSYRYNYK